MASVLYALLVLFGLIVPMDWRVERILDPDERGRLRLRSFRPVGLVLTIMCATFPSRLRAAP